MTFERRFLHCATWMLACHVEAMGGRVTGLRPGKLDFSLLGIVDWSNEMRLLANQELQRLSGDK
jgi:hypothetical protein